MKNLKLVVLFLFAMVIVTSCEKNDPDPVLEKVEDVDEKEGVITEYRVDGSIITKIKDYDVKGKELELQKDVSKHKEIWDLVIKIIPAEYLNKIELFTLFSGEKSGTAGIMFDTKEDLSKWNLGLALDFAYRDGFDTGKHLTYTIIHEFGHLISLNDSQIGPAAYDCSTFSLTDGCPKTDSYLNAFYNKFWADIYDEHIKVTENNEDTYAFYTKYKDRFITDYASVGIKEDFAETFAVFVVENIKPTGKTIAEKKILMLYTYPEFVSLRNQIRTNLGM